MFKMKLEELREKNIPASDDLVYTFNQRILEAMSSAKITYSIKGGPRKSKPWFDKDCYDMKKLAKESLKKYRKTNRLEDRECYASSRKKYLALLDLKRKGFDNEKQEILRNAKDSKTFWKTIALYKSTSIIQGEISIQDWLNFYRELMTTEKNLRICNLHNVISQNDPILDSEITNADIYKEIAGLRSNKACGPDGIPNEVLKTLPDSYILLLKQLYNSVMTTGEYPAIWTNSTIHPIFKNGYKNSPSNYRGGRVWTCQICQRSFIRSYDFRRHMKIHKDIRELYTCPNCPAAFTEKWNLRKHFQRSTTGERVHLRTPFCNSFFTAKNETAVNINRNLVSVYGEECMSIQMVRRWRSWFLEGRQNVHDDERSGRPVTATDNAAVAAVRNVVEADRRVTIDEIMIRLPPGIEIGRSSIGTIMSDVLDFRKVCARWVPRLLLENHKQQRMEAARAFLEMHQKDGDQLFFRIVTGDESWVHHSTPETKRQSMLWKKPEESAPKKAKVTISAGKVMAMENFKWEIFTHPPYSPELAPNHFHLFPSIKWHLGGKHFANDDEVQAEENHWLRRQDTAWYNSDIKKLLQRKKRLRKPTEIQKWDSPEEN
ncbi:hypothetical protein LAZ67_1001183 [Cordylochernes scorpioides]|uniref:C2H2-type domain-containing protein n=1 Tax=Cordylochernes scorpioides TaxID=51811 RepID=A0ABY6JZW6_9ARAC|nr:hypothetical protein LAZ67_1001183 [Cordylochernes scorpioides]